MSEVLRKVDTPSAQELGREGLTVSEGWSLEVGRALMEGARQPHVMDKTPRDALERFPTMRRAKEWFRDEEKQPLLYSIADSAIGGAIWFSKQTTEKTDAEWTFAIRMYEGLSGRGFAGRFLDAAHEDLRELTGYKGNVWLTTSSVDNDPAITLYLNHGYRIINHTDNRFKMIRSLDAE